MSVLFSVLISCIIDVVEKNLFLEMDIYICCFYCVDNVGMVVIILIKIFVHEDLFDYGIKGFVYFIIYIMKVVTTVVGLV